MDFWYLCLSMSIVEPQDVHWVHCELLLRWEIWVTFVSGLSESLWPALLAPQSNRSGGSFAWISESINLYLYIIIYIYYNIYIYRSENLRIWMILNVKYGKGHFEELICTDLYCGHFFFGRSGWNPVGIPVIQGVKRATTKQSDWHEPSCAGNRRTRRFQGFQRFPKGFPNGTPIAGW